MTDKKEPHVITLGPDDAALVLTSKGSEMHIPNPDDPEENMPEHVALIAAMGARLIADPDWAQSMLDWFSDEIDQQQPKGRA